MLHSRVMEYVDQVAHLGSIRAAGARLHVAASAINRQIILLEQELGEPLFERLPRGMRPTPAGTVLLTHIRRTQRSYRETIAEMHALQELPSGDVAIATVTGLASSIVAVVAARFRARHPDVRVTIRTMTSIQTLNAVAASEVDLGLGFNIPASTQVEVCWDRDSRLGAVIAPRHPLAGLATVPLALCAEHPLIFADFEMVMHGIITDAFAQAGISVEPAFRTTSIETMRRLAALGSAIAFLSRHDIADDEGEGRLTFRPLSGPTLGANVLSLVRPERHGHTPAGRLFADELTLELERVGR
ncbi:LysR family transcriptional regulator [Microbacterium sp. NPDC057650]|uniref:LysR family transcriptional regulator n=1 Tax=unclassified Microbacterium TaxID=2609290 RepID=UPI00366DBD53